MHSLRQHATSDGGTETILNTCKPRLEPRVDHRSQRIGKDGPVGWEPVALQSGSKHTDGRFQARVQETAEGRLPI